MEKESIMPNRIRHFRKLKGLSLKGLSRLAGLSVSHLSHIELGRRKLTEYWMRRLAEPLGVQPQDLLREGSSQSSSEAKWDSLFGAAQGVLQSLREHDLVDFSSKEIEALAKVMARAAEQRQGASDQSIREEIERTVVDLPTYRTRRRKGLRGIKAKKLKAL